MKHRFSSRPCWHNGAGQTGGSSVQRMHRTDSIAALRHGDRRHALALLGSLLYVLSALVLPSLHLGFHRSDHTHRGGGLQRLHGALEAHRHRAPHHHAAHELSAHEPQDESPTPEALAPDQAHALDVSRFAQLEPKGPQLSSGTRSTFSLQGAARLPAIALPESEQTSAPDPAHAAGSLSHFACAALSSPPPLALPAAAQLLDRAVYPSLPDSPRQRTRFAPKAARGPPESVVA